MTTNKKTILSIAYFPPIQYFSKIIKNTEFFIEKYENFTKQTYRNRCSILSANGLLNLSIPLIKQDKPKILIKDIKIDYKTNWQKNHFKAIESAYKSSPFYDYYIDDFMFVFEKKIDFLMDLNIEILKICIDIIEIETFINFTSDFIAVNNNIFDDYRYTISPKINFKSEPGFNIVNYHQVFSEKFDFVPNLSILDLIFNEGNHCYDYLEKCNKTMNNY